MHSIYKTSLQKVALPALLLAPIFSFALPRQLKDPPIRAKKVQGGGTYTGFNKDFPHGDEHTAKITVKSTPKPEDKRGYDEATVTIVKTRQFGNALQIVNHTKNSRDKMITRSNTVRLKNGRLLDRRNKQWHAIDNQVIENILIDAAQIAKAANGYFPFDISFKRNKTKSLFDRILDQEDLRGARLHEIFETSDY